nr:hypothetical protein [Variovorax boronicumulans]
MKNFKKRTVSLAGLAAAAFITAGCASVAVTGDAIERNTAQALGLNPGTFTISNRADEGVKTTYNVDTQAGRRYSCYVTGTVSVMGRVVSDAVCTELAGGRGQARATPAPAAAPAAAPACNALLKAAGRCQ